MSSFPKLLRSVTTSLKRKPKHAIRRSQSLTLGIVSFLLVFLFAFLGPLFTHSNPLVMDSSEILMPPTAQHPFGTDELGRDVFSRAMWGGRSSIVIGAATTVLTAVFGALIGMISGYNRRVGIILMRIMDVLMSFPSLLLALAMMAALGPSVTNVIIALSLAYVPRTARVVESAALGISAKPYIEAARAIGASTPRVLFRHVFPNLIAPLIVQESFIFAYAILGEAALSFVGVGVQPPTPSLGNIVGDARAFVREAPWLVFFPGGIIMLSVLSLNLMGDGLREVLDPKRKNVK